MKRASSIWQRIIFIYLFQTRYFALLYFSPNLKLTVKNDWICCCWKKCSRVMSIQQRINLTTRRFFATRYSSSKLVWCSLSLPQLSELLLLFVWFLLFCGCCCLDSCDLVWHWYCLSSSWHMLAVGIKILCVRMKSGEQVCVFVEKFIDTVSWSGFCCRN